MLTGQIVRPSDSDMHDPRGVIARIAGDEFAVILIDDADERGAVQFAEAV